MGTPYRRKKTEQFCVLCHNWTADGHLTSEESNKESKHSNPIMSCCVCWDPAMAGICCKQVGGASMPTARATWTT